MTKILLILLGVGFEVGLRATRSPERVSELVSFEVVILTIGQRRQRGGNVWIVLEFFKGKFSNYPFFLGFPKLPIISLLVIFNLVNLLKVTC